MQSEHARWAGQTPRLAPTSVPLPPTPAPTRPGRRLPAPSFPRRSLQDLRERQTDGRGEHSEGKLFLPVSCQAITDTRTSPGRQLRGSNGSRNKADFFFFFLPGNWLWCVLPYLPPPPPTHNPPSLFFFLRHGPGSGSWKRNKCGKRERKPELNDRMQAT